MDGKYRNIDHILGIIFILFATACTNQKQNLDYPKSLGQIESVTLRKLNRDDNNPTERNTEQKTLNEEEIKALLISLDYARPIGLSKFIPEYFITFKTKEGTTIKLRVRENTIKGYKNDFSYEFHLPNFLSKF